MRRDRTLRADLATGDQAPDSNLGEEEGRAVVEVHVALTVPAAPAVLQHVVHSEHVHRLVVLRHTEKRRRCF